MPNSRTLQWHRQLAGLAGLGRKLNDYLWLRSRLPSDAAYWEFIEPEFSMISPTQRDALKPLIEPVFEVHRRIASPDPDIPEAVVSVLLREDFPEVARSLELNRALSRRHGGVKGWVTRSPRSTDKALDMLQAYVERQRVISCQCLAELVCLHKCERDVSQHVDRVVGELREMYQTYLDRVDVIPLVSVGIRDDQMARRETQIVGHLRPADESHVFWTSADFRELPDVLTFLSFVQNFQPSGFEEVTRDATIEVESAILDHANFAFPLGERTSPHLAQPAASIAVQLWPLVDLPRTAHTVRPALAFALRTLWHASHPDGYWMHPRLPRVRVHPSSSEPTPLPNDCVTAGAALILATFGRRPEMQDLLQQAIQWLLQNQHQAGFWRDRVAEAQQGTSPVPHLEATCLAARALLRQPFLDPGDAVERAREWLLQQQESFGDWHELSGAPAFDTTLLVLDTLYECQASWSEMQIADPYLAASADLLNRSLEHLEEEDPGSVQIGVLLAFQAIELFLYSCLVSASVGANVFDGNQTIGFGNALTRLENYLRSTGQLSHGQVIFKRAELDRLQYLRGEVVHKGLRIALSDARPTIEAARQFARQFSPQFHGFVPFDMP